MHSLYVFGILTSLVFPIGYSWDGRYGNNYEQDSFIDWIFRLLMPSLSERSNLLLILIHAVTKVGLA